MCRKVTCRYCGKPTWSGCGKHIQLALRNYALEERCAGWETRQCPQKEECKYLTMYRCITDLNLDFQHNLGNHLVAGSSQYSMWNDMKRTRLFSLQVQDIENSFIELPTNILYFHICFLNLISPTIEYSTFALCWMLKHRACLSLENESSQRMFSRRWCNKCELNEITRFSSTLKWERLHKKCHLLQSRHRELPFAPLMAYHNDDLTKHKQCWIHCGINKIAFRVIIFSINRTEWVMTW